MTKRTFSLMLRYSGWMLTHEGIFKLTESVDAKTGGKKARWKAWKRVWPNAPRPPTPIRRRAKARRDVNL